MYIEALAENSSVVSFQITCVQVMAVWKESLHISEGQLLRNSEILYFGCIYRFLS